MDSENLNPKMPAIRTARIFLALAIFTGILSGASGGLIFCDMIAAVTGSVALLSLPHPSMGKIIRNAILLGLACLIGAVGAVYLIMGSLRFYCVSALTPALCCLAICLSIYKLRSRSFTVTLVTIILLLMLALTTLAAYLDSGGSLSYASIKELVTGFEDQLRELFNEALLFQSAEDSAALLNDTEITRMIRVILFIFPFLMYVFYVLAAFIITGLIRRILLGYTLGRRSLGGWLMTPSKISCVLYMFATVFCIFTLSFLLSLEYSGLGFGGVICLTSLAILLLTLPGCFAIGVRRTLFLFRTRRRFGLMGIICALFIGMFIPFFIFFYFGFAGAYHTVFDPIIAKKFQNFNPPGRGGPQNPNDPSDQDNSSDRM